MTHNLFKNLPWKIGGLLLAFALWFHLATEQTFHEQVMVDIKYENIPPGLALSPDSQKSAIVELSSDGKRLMKILYFDEVELVINLYDFTSPGSYSIAFHEDQLEIPSGKNDVYVKFIAPYACDFELVKQPQNSKK